MNKKFIQQKWLYISSIVIITFFLGACDSTGTAGKGLYDEFAQCLSDKGVKMYGAFWCGHCNEQKEMFGESFAYVDYVECDNQGENGKAEKCQEAKITGFPTWKFANGTELRGRQSFETLAGKADCEIPEV
jgi:hypothetical protein